MSPGLSPKPQSYILTMSYKISQVSESLKPTLHKDLRKHVAHCQGQVARARGFRKKLARALAQAACAGTSYVCVMCVHDTDVSPHAYLCTYTSSRRARARLAQASLNEKRLTHSYMYSLIDAYLKTYIYACIYAHIHACILVYPTQGGRACAFAIKRPGNNTETNICT